jgi:hypothetical protein
VEEAATSSAILQNIIYSTRENQCSFDKTPHDKTLVTGELNKPETFKKCNVISGIFVCIPESALTD